MEGITNGVERVTIAPSSPPTSLPLPSEDTMTLFKRNFPYRDIDAALFTRQSWVRQVDAVHHRRRGILITHDTYNDFRLSFEDDQSASSFLGELLVSVSTSDHVVRLSELQLENVNSQWDENPRFINPKFAPVNLPLIMSTETIYSLSTEWEIVKTLYYIALSQDMLDKLFEEAICKTSLNGLEKVDSLPMVENLPDTRQPNISIEVEVAKALRSASIEAQTNEPPSKHFEELDNFYKALNLKANTTQLVCALVERLISMTKVGRRERSESFLNISEVCVPRLLPRVSMENISKAIRFVHIEKDNPKEPLEPKIDGIRALLLRRPVGTIGKSGLDQELAKSIQQSSAVHTLLGRGDGRGLTRLDKNEKQLLYCANTCYHDFGGVHTEECSIRGMVDFMVATRSTWYI
ncbi:hypothetical protein EIK77_008886 [Talaromyces pinophilus]|nr:hypothetical protein EIK77_008886 [Talaromyces pinophilus]